MTTDFSSLNLRDEILQAITELGYTEPTPIQAGMIPLMLTGADVIGQAQTGTGKTAAFALPILHNFTPQKNPQALILAPTRELALQVANSINEYGKGMRVRVLAVYGGQPYSPQINALRRGVDIVVGAPGRLNDLLERGALRLNEIKTLVLDEADEMLNMGFIEDVEKILSTTPPGRQTALFSATLPARIRALADRFMRDPQAVTIKRATLTLASTEQRCCLVHESDKLSALTRLFETEPIHSALIFARTRAETAALANELVLRGIPAEAIHGDLDQHARERVLGRFRSNQLKVLVATDVAARGLDIENISHVFNYHLPDDAEVYVHRIGRTGRAGRSGVPHARGRSADEAARHQDGTSDQGRHPQTPRGQTGRDSQSLAGTRPLQARTGDRQPTRRRGIRSRRHRGRGLEDGARRREAASHRGSRRSNG
ncbi:MAG: hypothetical protein B6D40_12395 [Anaerolineae bacterium UTCFX3]|nr:MAG: hypothetical protein B6D40_12395 [Anaerolineae bacterium UTCFX3]